MFHDIIQTVVYVKEIELTAAVYVKEIELTAAQEILNAWLFQAVFQNKPFAFFGIIGVRAASRSISNRWGSIRFRLAPRTYDAPSCGPQYVWCPTA